MNANIERTGQFLRRVLFSVPAMIIAGVVGAYVLAGFLLAPVVVKWQVEKQVQDKLAHRITLGKLRINPLKLTAEANDVELRDAAGGTLIAFSRLFVDFELRSIIDRAWTFAAVALEQPAVRIELDQEGRLNFLPLVEALRGPAQEEEGGPLPRLLVQHMAVRGGRVEFTDRQLAEPLVTRATPVEIDVTDLSTLPSGSSPYRLSARTAAGETVRWSGVLRLNPLGSDGRLALSGLQMATLARALHEHVSIAAPAGRIDVSAEYRFSYKTGALSGGVDRLEISAAGLSVTPPGASAPLLALDSVALKDARVDLATREIVVPRVVLGKGTLALRVDDQGDADWRKFLPGRAHAAQAKHDAGAKSGAPDASWNVALEGVEVADMAVLFSDNMNGRAAEIAAAATSFSGKIVAGGGGARIALNGPRLSLTGSNLNAGDDRLAVPTAALESAALYVAIAGPRFDIRIEQPKATAAKVAVQRGDSGLEGATYSFEGQRITAVGAPGTLELGVDAPRFAAESVMLKQGGDRVDVGNAAFQGKKLSVVDEGAALRIGGDGAQLALSGLVVGTKSGENDLLRVESGRAGAKTLALSLAQGGAAVSGDGLSAELSGVLIQDPRTAEELARVGRAQLAGGSLHSRERIVAADSVLLADGGVRAALDAKGGFNWARLVPGATATSGATGKSETSGAPGWRIAARIVELKNFGVAFSDAGYDPPAAIALHGIQARLAEIDTGANAAANLELRAKVRRGGDIAIGGTLDPRNGKSDLKVKIAALALAPAQSYLSRFAHLEIASGTLSAEGRLRYGDPAAGASVVYEGSAAVDQFLLEETEPRRPFLSWESVAASGLALTVSPHRLDVSELRVNAPEGSLIMAEEQGANFSRLLKKAQEAGASEKPAAQAPDDDPFPVSVARIRVERGVLEFADFSLRPQFSTRMHDLKGVVTGFATSPASRAKLQLDARVDRYGIARIEGEINALRPEAHTDVNLTFRNMEMTALTPYVAKFAGYRIAGGKLSVDLDYRIEDSLLVGKNHIVLEKLELGEKVESPDALDLPLELAIALLQDAKGVIDLGVPVTGNLEDPQFDYGEIIGKAVGNLIGGIVTAPFRALGALFGSGPSDDLGSIEFEPGIATLIPPEREKLATMARALEHRPQLRLTVVPAFAADEDLAALKSAAVRREILSRVEVKLAPGEEPGPVDVTNARTQRALEAMFAQRHSSTLLGQLKRRHAGPEADAGQGGEHGKRVPGALHRILLERLISEQPVSESALRALAAERGAAILQELTKVGGVAPARISLGEVQAATEFSGKRVSSRLELGAAP